MKTCSIYGCDTRATRPMASASSGVSRQPSMLNPSSCTIRSIMASHSKRGCGSTGRNNIPTPYSPSGGSVKPSLPHSLAKKVCGIWMVIPAPSPVFGSEPLAPRCARFTNIWIPFMIVSCERSPFTLTIKPIPHASCSLRGSYNGKSLNTSEIISLAFVLSFLPYAFMLRLETPV